MADYSLVKGSSTVLSTGDVAYINGFAGEFKVKAKNGIITLTSKSDKTVFYTVSATSGAKLAFLDGAATVAKSKVSLAVKGLDSAVNSKETFSFVAPAAFTLTAGINTVAGTSRNEIIDATENDAGAATLSAMDVIDGGAGTDTLRVVDATAIDTTAIAGLEITNVENITFRSAEGVTTNTTGFTGVTSLSITSADDVAATAAATTDVTVKASALSSDGTAAVELAVNGGKNVTVTSADTLTLGAGTAGGQIAIGGTTAAAGVVKVTHTETVADAAVAGASTGTTSAITVTGGTSVEVNSLVTAGTAERAGDIATVGTVTVNGNASTTSVKVVQSAATEAFGTPAANTKIKITNGAVNITDTNAATAADTLATVTLENFGATRIDSSALSTLNVKGGATATTASGNLDLRKTTTDTTTLPTTLTVNSSGGQIGNLGVAASSTMANAYTAVNVNSSAATTFANAGLAANKTLTVSGAGVTTFTAFTAGHNAALTSVVSTGAGLTIGTELATGVAVTGGDGVETISVGATTKAINLGGGNDVLTISATPGAGGTLNGGAGTGDVIVANTNASSLVADPSITGFEILRVAGAAAQGAHVATGFTGLQVGSLGGGNASFTQVAAGVGLTQLATMGNNLEVVLANATGTADTFNLTLSSADAIGAATQTITLAGVETINITSTDTDTTAHVNVTDLVVAAAKTVNVSGNAGLDFQQATANTAITTFNASGVVLGKVTDTGVTFDSTNATVGEVVTITGSNGVDSLTGSATAKDIISGGAGVDTIVYDGGADEFTGGAGNDVFDINALGTSTVMLTIKDLSVGDTIDLAGVARVNTGAVTLGAKVSLGAAATFAQYLDAAAVTVITADAASLVKWFQFEGNTYLVVDNDPAAAADTTTFDANDGVVKMTGLIDLSTSTVTNTTNILTVVAV